MIIQKLIEEGFCFAVMQSWSYLTKAKIYSQQEWEIIALEDDFSGLKKLGFNKQNHLSLAEKHRNPKGIIGRDMTVAETNEFKRLKEDYFVKVLESEDGSIWELKEKSLKENITPALGNRL